MKSPALQIKREQKLRLTAVFLVIITLAFILLAVENLLISFVLAFSSAYLLSPLVRYLERIGLNRTWAILIPFLSLLILTGVLITIAIPLILEQSQEFRSELPKYIEGTSFLISKWEKQFKEFFPYVFKFNFAENFAAFLETSVTKLIQAAPKLAQQFLTVCLLAPLFSYFLLKDGHTVSRRILSLFPNNLFEMALSLTHKINVQLGQFIRARLIEAIIVGVVVWIGLTCLAFPYAIFLALFAVIMNLIPYVGPFIGAIPAFIIAIVNQEPALAVFLMSAVYFFAQLVDIVFVIPLVVARTVNLHPVTVIVVFIIGAHLMGILGMIIAVPLASIFKLIFFTIYDQLIKFRA